MSEEPKKKKYKSGSQKRREKANSIANTPKLDSFYSVVGRANNISNVDVIDKNNEIQINESINDNVDVIDKNNEIQINESISDDVDVIDKNNEIQINESISDDVDVIDKDNESIINDRINEKNETNRSNEIDENKKIDHFELKNDNPSDKAYFNGSMINDETRILLAKHGACQPQCKVKLNDKDFDITPYYSYHHEQAHDGCSSIKVHRSWLAFSPLSKQVYCHDCWLFADKRDDWSQGFEPNTKHLLRRIKRHERNHDHIASSATLLRWKTDQTIGKHNEKDFKKNINFWREVLRRIINIILTMAILCLAFRGHNEKVGDGLCEGGNFLGLVTMQACFDPFLQEIINSPKRSVRYLSASIQNELIKLIAKATRSSILQKMSHSPFYSILVDSTSDISRTDQLSVIIRWVDISDMSVKESFMGFLIVRDGTALGLTNLVTEYFEELGLDIKKVRGQGYDGASVMSGNKGGVQKLMSDYIKSKGVDSPIPFVHCSSHNLNLVINDAAEASVESETFFATLSEIFNFFGRSLNRWADLALTESTVHKLKLKRLCTTRWSSRIDSVRAIKNRYVNIMQVLSKIILTSDDKEEREKATSLKEKMDSFEFVLFLVIWESVLASLNIASKELQSVSTDLSVSITLLTMARSELQRLRNSWDSVLEDAKMVAKSWNNTASFKEVRSRRIKNFFDEICNDERLKDAESNFRVNIFNRILDVALFQLDSRFVGQSQVTDMFSFLQPWNLVKYSAADLSTQVKKFLNIYGKDINEDPDMRTDLDSEIRQFKMHFVQDIEKMKSVSEILNKLFVTNLIPSFPALTTLCILFVTLPVTVASAERSFSKLKIIKNYLRSTMRQDRLDDLSMISIENEEARALDLDGLIDAFAEKNARRNSRLTE